MPVIAPTLRCLESAAGNPLANPVSGCEANDQSDYTGGHCSAPPLPSRLASRSSIRRTRSRTTVSQLQRSQQRAPGSLTTGAGLLPMPTITPPQIEQGCTGFMVMVAPSRGRAPLVPAATPPDLFDRANCLLGSANGGRAAGSPGRAS